MIPDDLKDREPLTKQEVDAMSVSTGNWGPGAFERLRAEWYRSQILIKAANKHLQLNECNFEGDHPGGCSACDLYDALIAFGPLEGDDDS